MIYSHSIRNCCHLFTCGTTEVVTFEPIFSSQSINEMWEKKWSHQVWDVFAEQRWKELFTFAICIVAGDDDLLTVYNDEDDVSIMRQPYNYVIEIFVRFSLGLGFGEWKRAWWFRVVCWCNSAPAFDGEFLLLELISVKWAVICLNMQRFIWHSRVDWRSSILTAFLHENLLLLFAYEPQSSASFLRSDVCFRFSPAFVCQSLS